MRNGEADAVLLARLNDLLQLEYDALPSYRLAISLLRTPEYRDALGTYLADHERHVRDLTDMIHARGSVAMRIPHIPTGAFKLAVQAAGGAGGERAVLLAFRANEQQSRDKYARAAEDAQPPEVAALLHRHAQDEARHFDWVCSTLDRLGAGADTTIGAAVGAFATFHGGVADAVEAVGRYGMETAYRLMRSA